MPKAEVYFRGDLREMDVCCGEFRLAVDWYQDDCISADGDSGQWRIGGFSHNLVFCPWCGKLTPDLPEVEG